MKIILLVLLAFVAETANACSCAGRLTAADQYKEARIVFVGRVESVRYRQSDFWLKVRHFFHLDPPFQERNYCSDYGQEVTFGVMKAWKGVESRRVVLLTGRGGGDCGVEFTTGTDYIVYAWPPGESGCQTDICTRTRELSQGAEDLEFLQQKPVLKIR